MTVPGTAGLGDSPSPLHTLLSDRAGDVDPAAGAEGPVEGSLSHALRALDAIEGSMAPVAAIGSVDVSGQVPPPVPVPGPPSRREEILDGASLLFAERGYHGASLRDISRRVGISHPGMLHHFSSKDVLLGAVIDRLEGHAQSLLDSGQVLQDSPKALLAALGGPWDPRCHQMSLLATLSAEVVNPEHPGRFRVARLRLVHEHVLEKVFSAYQEQGALRDGFEPALLARSVFSLLLSLAVRERSVGPLQQAASADPVEDVRTLLRQVVERGER